MDLRHVLLVLLTIGIPLILTACGPQASPDSNQDQDSTEREEVPKSVGVFPTQTLVPTYTLYPTYTPLPTLTQPPTYTPIPTPMPTATTAPVPTATPEPTPTQPPTPTPTAVPTPTAMPTAKAAVLRTMIPEPTVDPALEAKANKDFQEAAQFWFSVDRGCENPEFDGFRGTSDRMASIKALRVKSRVMDGIDALGPIADFGVEEKEAAARIFGDAGLEIFEICYPRDWEPGWARP